MIVNQSRKLEEFTWKTSQIGNEQNNHTQGGNSSMSQIGNVRNSQAQGRNSNMSQIGNVRNSQAQGGNINMSQIGNVRNSQAQGGNSNIPASNKAMNKAMSHKPNLYYIPMGRLGNQIFEFTTAYCTALQSNHTSTIENSSSLLKLFHLEGPKRITTAQLKAAHSTQISGGEACVHYSHVLNKARNTLGEVTLTGHLQSYKYMLPCWEDLKKELILVDRIQSKSQDYIHLAVQETKRALQQYGDNLTFIGVHVRRGDRKKISAPVKFFKIAF